MLIHRAIHLNKLAYLIPALCGMTSALYGEQADSRVAPEDFAILPWGWTPGDAETLAEIKACGFNLAGFVAADNVPAVRRRGSSAS